MYPSMHTIDSFIRKVEEFAGGFSFSSDDFQESVSPSIYQHSILFSQVLKMKEYFKRIKSFVDDVYSAFPEEIITDGRKLKNGDYVKALAFSIVGVLEDFSNWDLVELGSEPWSERGLAVATTNIFSTIQMAEFILRDLEHLIMELIDSQLYGCQILNLTMRYTQCGNPPIIEKFFQRIHSGVELVMLHQVASWVIKGDLHSDELFVKQLKHDQVETPERLGKMYNIDANFLPEYMRYSLAQKILSVGQLLVFLKNVPANIEGAQDMEGGGLFGIDEMELLGKFKQLEMKFSRNLLDLQILIDEISSLLNKRAVLLCWGVGGLKREIELLSEVALLTRSDLASRFLSAVGEKLLAHPTGIGNHLMFTHELETAAEDIGLDPSTYASRFQLVLPPRKTNFPSNCDTLSLLRFQYKVPWPLHFLIGDQELTVLNSAFNLLVRIRLARLHAADAHFAALREDRGKGDSKLVVHLHWLSVLASELEYHFLSNAAGLSASMRNELAVEGADVFALRRCFRLFINKLAQTLFLPAQVQKELEKVLESMELTSDAVINGNESKAFERFHYCYLYFQEFYHMLDEAATVQNIDSAVSLLQSLKPICSSRISTKKKS